MRKKRRNGGFTMAELLIVVAIIGVLSGVAFVAVQRHEKSMTQLELDTVAKEIFVAAQNHLTLAKGQNYNGSQQYGSEGTVEGDYKGEGTQREQIVYYFMDSDFPEAGNDSLLNQMLPFGSIDETIRAGGNYMIRYQPSAGLVLDVFYWKASDKKYGGSNPGYDTLVGLRDEDEENKKSERQANRPMLGWFGGGETVVTGEFLATPSIEVENADKLYVKVTDNNIYNDKTKHMQPMLKLIIRGKESEARMAFTLNYYDDSLNESGKLGLPGAGVVSRLSNVEETSTEVTYTIVLDDITTGGMRFADIESEAYLASNWLDTKRFYPGEDIIIQAVAYSNKYLTSVAYSGEWTVNSLFGELREETDGNVALISNIRHLENLDDRVSNVAYSNDKKLFNGSITAEQNTDLDWSKFFDGESVSIYSYGTGENDINITYPGCYLPVSPSYPLTYNGQSEVVNGTSTEKINHKVSNIAVNNVSTDFSDFTPPTGTEAAAISAGGMFGTLVAGSSVSNLELLDFGVYLTSGDAGALAGKLTGTALEDNKTKVKVENISLKNAVVSVAEGSGNVGGLIGSAGYAEITNVIAFNTNDAIATEITSGAASVSSGSTGGTGGLIGSANNSAVSKSAAALIVSSTGGNAGGLIGTTSGGTITACYSGGHTTDGKYTGTTTGEVSNYNVTASKGTVGGLIGAAGSTAIDYSYSTCSVSGATAGGFVGTSTGTGKIEYCYATGLVRGTDKESITIDSVTISDVPKDGAFAYSLATGVIVTDCKYFEIINERSDDDNGFDYLTPLGKKGNLTGENEITAIDADVTTYNNFVGAPGDWENATVYDATLTTYYGTGNGDERKSLYNLQTVDQLLKNDKDNTNDDLVQELDYVATHYGDWPAPEIFVLNDAGE